MLFACNVDGMEIRLRIDNYQSPSKHKYGDWWCDCGFSFQFGDIIHYSMAQGEILTPEDVDELHAELSKLLSGEMAEITEISFTEPDFEFILYPNGDIQAEWKVNLWHSGALTANFFTIVLGENEIALLNQFLDDCIKRGD